MRQQEPQILDELKKLIRKAWNNVDLQQIRIKLMPNRRVVARKQKGGPK
jgi:hypothetical protein